jgi:hypothetical protein
MHTKWMIPSSTFRYLFVPPISGEYQAARYVVHDDGSYDVIDDLETGMVCKTQMH